MPYDVGNVGGLMRFVAPARADVARERFDHAVFADYRSHHDLLLSEAWPGLAELNRRMAVVSGDLRFVEQDAVLQADGLHYELRIARHGQVATRASNWHDLLNALVWLEYTPLKRALNARQAADIARVGPRERTRGQCALTHFDEAGVLVILPDAAALPAWDGHDWSVLFLDCAPMWREQARIVVFGHALLEHALYPQPYLVGKAVIMVSQQPLAACIARLADAIAAGETLVDPQELRPLPLAGIAGWHAQAGTPDFYRNAPCFQPIRNGRRYPPPLSF